MSRRARTLLVPFVIAGGAVAALGFFSCDGGDSSSSSEGETTTIEDPSQASTIALDGANVGIPPGAFEAGTTLTAKPTDTPDTFTAAEGVTQASPALEVSATDAEGEDLSKAQAPMTIALSFDDAAALADVERTAANICVFALSKDGAFIVWRPNTVTLDEAAKTVSYASIWLGVFQLFYCGDAEIPGATFADDTGKSTAGGDSDAPQFYGSCLVKTENQDGTAGQQCQAIVGSAFQVAANQGEFKSECGAGSNSTWTAGETCPTADAIGVCSYFDGTTMEVSLYYYKGSEELLESYKDACESVKTSKWYAVPADYKPGIGTKSIDTSTDTGSTQTSTGTSTEPAGDMPEGTWSCNNTQTQCYTYFGQTWLDKTQAERESQCGGAEYFFEGACPMTGVVGICHMSATMAAFAYDRYFTTDASEHCATTMGEWEAL